MPRISAQRTPSLCTVPVVNKQSIIVSIIILRRLTHTFIHSISRNYGPGTVPGPRDTAKNAGSQGPCHIAVMELAFHLDSSKQIVYAVLIVLIIRGKGQREFIPTGTVGKLHTGDGVGGCALRVGEDYIWGGGEASSWRGREQAEGQAPVNSPEVLRQEERRRGG